MKQGSKKTAGPCPAPLFEVREEKLCAELGFGKDELRRRRQYFLTEGQHWAYVNKRVLLSRVGAEVLRGTRGAVVPPGPEKNGAAGDSGAGPRRVVAGLLCERNPRAVEFGGELVVWASPGHNRHVVVCYLPGTDPGNPMNLVTLSVRDNGNFMRGMVVPGEKPPGNQVRVVRVKDREDRFELQGQCPRWRGKW